MRIFYIAFLISLFSFGEINAQKIVTLEEAVNIALKNNYDILVARSNADIDKLNNTAGNAGMLPKANINASGSFSLEDQKQKLSSGTENNYNGLSSTGIIAGAELSWTLFDGGKMFVTKSKLAKIEELGEIQFKDQVVQSIYSVVASYYNVVKQKQQLAALNDVMSMNNERLIIAQAGFTAGSLIKTDLLQAKIDVNTTKESVINQQYIIEESRKSLNALLGLSSDSVFEVLDSIPLDFVPNNAALAQQLDSSNSTILAYKQQLEISQLAIKENQRAYSPIVNLRAGYYFSLSNNSAGNVLSNQITGPQIIGSVVIPLYSAGENKRKISVAKMNVQATNYDLENVRLQQNIYLQNALTDFKNQQHLLAIEKENNELTQEFFQISLQRLKLGQTTSLEVHAAQDAYMQSSTRLLNFEYGVKMAEIRLKQLVATY